MGKGEIARNEQFLLFPQCFQKLFVLDASKWVFMELRVKQECFAEYDTAQSENHAGTLSLQA